MTPFEKALAHTLGIEGGYSNHASDLGGATHFGIIEAVARKHGYTGDMRDLQRGFAIEIYRKDYWLPLSLPTISTMSEAVALELFDTGVNMGIAKAAEFFQIALNALNDGGKHYKDITEDGDIGPATIGAFAAYLKRRGVEGEDVMLKALDCLQGHRYIEISRMRAANEAFVFGWLRTRI